jgi:hypothetical protein
MCSSYLPLGVPNWAASTANSARLDAARLDAADVLRVGLVVDAKASVVAGLHLAPLPLSRRQKP